MLFKVKLTDLQVAGEEEDTQCLQPVFLFDFQFDVRMR